MTIKLQLPKWLATKFAKRQPPTVARAQLKQRQVLPTLPKNQPNVTRLQDDDSPPGYRIQWRL
jgi:hypothetical protein